MKILKFLEWTSFIEDELFEWFRLDLIVVWRSWLYKVTPVWITKKQTKTGTIWKEGINLMLMPNGFFLVFTG